MAMSTRKTEYRSRAVERAFDVLSVLASTPGATLADVSRATGIPGSTLLGILGSLAECRAVRTDGKRFELGVALLQLGQAYSHDADLVGLFTPVGQRLRALLDETVQLGVMSGHEAVYIARQESTQPVRLVALVGRTIPAHASAVGKAHLAELDEPRLRALIGDEPFLSLTPDTITSYDELLLDLEATRRRRFAESRGECIPGLHCVSAPVFDAAGEPVAALAVSTPQFRMDSDRRRVIAREVQRAATEISQALGAISRHEPEITPVASA